MTRRPPPPAPDAAHARLIEAVREAIAVAARADPTIESATLCLPGGAVIRIHVPREALQ